MGQNFAFASPHTHPYPGSEGGFQHNKRPMGLSALLENQLGHWQNFQKLHIYFLSTKGSLFSLNGQQFLRYRLISKIQTWPLTKISDVHLHFLLSSYPRIFFLLLFKDIHKDDYIAQMHHIVRQRQHTQYSKCTKRVHMQPMELWPMAKFHAQIWQFWKFARILGTSACRAKIISILTPCGRKKVYIYI